MITFYLDAVEDFHAAFKYRYPTPVLPAFDHETIRLRLALLREELSGKNELLDCMSRGDDMGTLDGLCDLQYVLSGAILALGLRAKFLPAYPTRPENRLPDVPRELLATTIATRFDSSLKSLEEFLMVGDVSGAVDQFVRLQQSLSGLVRALGFVHFDWAFAKVHEANMAKLWNPQQVLDCDKDSSPVHYFDPSETGFIARRADGKIVKPPGHVEADLSDCLARA